MFHHFSSPAHPRGQGAIDSAEFHRLLHQTGTERILPAGEFVRRAGAGVLGERDLCLTFDDNLRCQYDVALPVMRELGLTGFFFVYTSVLRGALERLEIYRYFRTVAYPDIGDFYQAFYRAVGASPHAVRVAQALSVFDPARYLGGFPFYTREDRVFRYTRDRVLGPADYSQVMDRMIERAGMDLAGIAKGLWMDAGQLQELHSEGHVIGLHSDTHPTQMASLTPAAQRREYETNFDELTRMLGARPTTMSHPCNSYDESTLDALRSMGITLGFRANMAGVGTPSGLEVPREDHANLVSRMAA